MRLAASTLSLPALTHAPLLPYVRAMGFSGVEIVPARVWEGAVISACGVNAYRRALREADLRVVGMDTLLAGRPELGLFGDGGAVARTVEHVAGLSAACRDLGGHTLLWGMPRHRGPRSIKEAWEACAAFLDRLLPRIEGHGTILCFEPLRSGDGNVCATTRECRALADYVGHRAFGLALGSAALTDHNETGQGLFCLLHGRVETYHADEPALGPLGEAATVDHLALRHRLAAIGYRDWITLKQRMTAFPLDSLYLAAERLKALYLRGEAPANSLFSTPKRSLSA